MKDKHDAVKLAFKRCGALNNIDGSEDNEITWPERDTSIPYCVSLPKKEEEKEAVTRRASASSLLLVKKVGMGRGEGGGGGRGEHRLLACLDMAKRDFSQ